MERDGGLARYRQNRQSKQRILAIPKSKRVCTFAWLKNAEEWHSYCASEKKPKYIPSNPNLVYNNLNESII